MRYSCRCGCENYVFVENNTITVVRPTADVRKKMKYHNEHDFHSAVTLSDTDVISIVDELRYGRNKND